jgi:hypothetical protein
MVSMVSWAFSTQKQNRVVDRKVATIRIITLPSSAVLGEHEYFRRDQPFYFFPVGEDPIVPWALRVVVPVAGTIQSQAKAENIERDKSNNRKRAEKPIAVRR